jgi:hypothetical protein
MIGGERRRRSESYDEGEAKKSHHELLRNGPL